MADGIEKLPRGIRNKNPGNIKLGTEWDGLASEQSDPTFCIFDEVDAPLDDANIDKFNKIINKFSNTSQFIIHKYNASFKFPTTTNT